MAKILSHKRADTRAGVEGQIRHIMDRLEKSVQSRDIEGILAMYAENVVFFDVRDSLEHPKDGLRRSWEASSSLPKNSKSRSTTHDSCGWRSRLQSLSQPRYG